MFAVICLSAGCTFGIFLNAFFGIVPLRRKFSASSRRWYILQHVQDVVTNNRLTYWISTCVDQITSNQRPIALILWLSLMYVIAATFLSHVWTTLELHHQTGASILLPLPYIFTCLCTNVSARSRQLITPVSHDHHMDRYPYDYKLYHPGSYCEICRFIRPARSKHCSRCGVCVARMDHHCIWVNNCIGRGNHKYFLALLLSVTVTLAYGSYLAYMTLPEQARQALEQHLGASSSASDGLCSISRWLCYWQGWYNGAQVSIQSGATVQLVTGVFAFPMSFLPAALLVYQLCLISRGTTTYESGKQAAWRREAEQGRLWVIPLEQNNSQFAGSGRNSWSTQSSNMVVSTHDGLPPHHLSEQLQTAVAGHAKWTKCMDFDSLENIYDRGFWGNLWEILYY